MVGIICQCRESWHCVGGTHHAWVLPPILPLQLIVLLQKLSRRKTMSGLRYLITKTTNVEANKFDIIAATGNKQAREV